MITQGIVHLLTVHIVLLPPISLVMVPMVDTLISGLAITRITALITGSCQDHYSSGNLAMPGQGWVTLWSESWWQLELWLARSEAVNGGRFKTRENRRSWWELRMSLVQGIIIVVTTMAIVNVIAFGLVLAGGKDHRLIIFLVSLLRWWYVYRTWLFTFCCLTPSSDTLKYHNEGSCFEIWTIHILLV